MSSERDSRDEEKTFVYHDSEPSDLPKLPDQSALEEVLRETLAAQQSEPLQDGELDVLLTVARRYPGVELSKEPIAADLVESILRLRLTGLDATPEYWLSMSRAIADSLFETPSTRARLDSLWRSLLEAAV